MGVGETLIRRMCPAEFPLAPGGKTAAPHPRGPPKNMGDKRPISSERGAPVP